MTLVTALTIHEVLAFTRWRLVMGSAPSLSRHLGAPDCSTPISQTYERIANRATNPPPRHQAHHGTLLIKAEVSVIVVPERLGRANPAFTIDTYQHVLPGMQAEAARTSKSAHPRGASWNEPKSR